MATDVETFRELARAYWAGEPVKCPKHAGIAMTGSFVQTTFADHIFLTCPRGKETLTIPQRPRQQEFQSQQIEGLVENLQRGDSILCYRCQASFEIVAADGRTTFTCIRCFSWGTWQGGVQA